MLWLAGWLETVAASVAILDLDLGEGEDVNEWFVKHDRSADEMRNLMLSAPRLEAAPPTDRRDVEELLTLVVRSNGESRCAATGSGVATWGLLGGDPGIMSPLL